MCTCKSFRWRWYTPIDSYCVRQRRGTAAAGRMTKYIAVGVHTRMLTSLVLFNIIWLVFVRQVHDQVHRRWRTRNVTTDNNTKTLLESTQQSMWCTNSMQHVWLLQTRNVNTDNISKSFWNQHNRQCGYANGEQLRLQAA